MNLAHYLGLVHRRKPRWRPPFGRSRIDTVMSRMSPGMRADGRLVGTHASGLRPFVEHYGEHADDEPELLHSEIFRGTRQGGLALLRDLHDLYLVATECSVSWVVVGQAAAGTRDTALGELVSQSEQDTTRQLKWLLTRMKQAAPQALVVA